MATTSQRTTIRDADDDIDVKVTSDGYLQVEAVKSDDKRYTIAIEYDSSNNPIYVGEAAEGTVKTASSWRIKKITYDSSNNPTNIQWASGDDLFDKIWNDRTTYSYS